MIIWNPTPTGLVLGRILDQEREKMISKVVSVDIIEYLQNKKGMSIEDIADAMGTTPSHIKLVIKNKAVLTSGHINAYVKSSGKHFWEFALAAVPLLHLPERARNRVLLCRDLNRQLKKKGEK